MSKRRKFFTEFKVKVALEALTGELTLAELASKDDVHPTMIAGWKRQAKEGIVAGFGQLSGFYSAVRGPETIPSGRERNIPHCR